MQDGKRLLELAEACGLLGTVIKPQTERNAPFLSFADQITSSHFILLLLDDQVSLPLQPRACAVVADAGTRIRRAIRQFQRSAARSRHSPLHGRL
ncbi:MAG: hypothetical protein U0521_01405 [Anaerolineae bacterium]